MPENLKAMTLRLQQDVPLAEASLDSALIAFSTLMTSVVTARQRVGVAPQAGQASIMRLAKAQLSLVEVSGDVLRVRRSEEHTSEIQTITRTRDSSMCVKQTITLTNHK